MIQSGLDLRTRWLFPLPLGSGYQGVFQKTKLAGELNVAVQLSFYRSYFSLASRTQMFEFLALVDGREARAASVNLYITLRSLKSRGLKCFPQTGQQVLVSVQAG